MQLKYENIKALNCFSKLGKKIGKQNLVLYRWSLQKKYRKRSSSVSPAVLRIKFLYNIKKLRSTKKSDDNDNNIFSIEEKERQKLEEFAEEIENKKEYKKRIKYEDRDKKDIKQNKSKLMSHKYLFNKIFENKKKIQPSCTKYNPKYETIFKKIVYSPSWKSMLGRKDQAKIDNSEFYLKHDLIQNQMAGKTFIDFSKQSKRSHNLFDRADVNFINKDNYSKSKSLIFRKKAKKRMYRNKSQIIFNNNTSKIDKDLSQQKSKINYRSSESDILSTSNSNDSFDLFKQIYTKKLKKKIHKEKNTSEKTSNSVKAIDFNQIISRETLEDLKSKNLAIVPYLFPNFSLVRDRPIMMVIYDKKTQEENKYKKRRPQSGTIEFNLIDSGKNKNRVHTPNFNLMKSRPFDDNDPFPSHMRGVFNKNTCFKITSESLKSTNYSKSGFIMPNSSFWKNSFNKYTNLKQIKSYSNNMMNSLLQNEYIDVRTKRLLKLYNKNYNSLMGGKTKYSKLENDINQGLKKHENKSIKELILELQKKD